MLLALALPVILGVVTAPALRAQAQSDLRFEVASVKRVEIPAVSAGVPVFPVTGGVGSSEPRRIAYRGTWLTSLVAEAFGVRADQIAGPGWLSHERYDIVANIPEGTTKAQFNIMLGNLLRDRFHLRFHMEPRIHPVYALRVAKNGPKFKETAGSQGETAAAPSRGAVGPPDAEGFPVLPPDYRGMVGRPVNGEMRWSARNVPMADFARSLEQSAGRPIIDETGLAGRYDFRIHYEWIRRPTAAGVAPEPSTSVFTAVEEQLGLKLEPSTAPLLQLTIDSIDREPTDN